MLSPQGISMASSSVLKASKGGKTMEHTTTIHPLFGPVIVTCTRQDAIRDGILIDVSEIAAKLGIRLPTAVTQTVWERIVVPPEAVKGIQDEKGRLWDIIWMFLCAALGSKSPEIQFSVMLKDSYNRPARQTVLKAVIGPGDQAEPVITIMMPFESQQFLF